MTIYEKTDEYGVSAVKQKEKSTCKTSHYKEIELNTGLRHGFLFQPLEAWMQPTQQWARGDYN